MTMAVRATTAEDIEAESAYLLAEVGKLIRGTAMTEMDLRALRSGDRLVIQDGQDREVGEVVTVIRTEWRTTELLIRVRGTGIIADPYWIKPECILRRAGV